MTAQNDLLGVANPEELVQRDLMDPSGSKWSSTLTELVAVLENQLRKDGITETLAAALAPGLALALGEYLGGRQVYLPRGNRLRTALKHAQAWRMWRGNNIEEIMQLLGVTQARAYVVIAEQRALHRGKLQPGLFKAAADPGIAAGRVSTPD